MPETRKHSTLLRRQIGDKQKKFGSCIEKLPDWITQTENHVTHQQSPHRQIPQVNRQKQTAIRRRDRNTRNILAQSKMRKRGEQAVVTINQQRRINCC